MTRSGSILAVHPGALGDVVLFGRLLERLDGRVTLVARGQKGRLLAALGVAAAAVDFDAVPMHEVFGDAPLAACRLAELLGRHERLISCFGEGDRAAERRLADLCGASEAAFLPTRPAESFGGHLLDLWADRLKDKYPAASAALGAREAGAWRVPDARRREAAEALGRAGLDAAGPYAIVHPGAGSPAKCWPLAHGGLPWTE